MCILWYRSFISKWCSPSVLKLQWATAQSHRVCGHPGQPLLEHSPASSEVPVLVYLLASAWGKPISTGEVPGSCLSSHYWYTPEHTGSCYFAASCQSDPLWYLKGNWPNFTSNKHRDKKKKIERTQNKRLQVSLSKQATKIYNYFSVCTAMLVNLLTVFAYFHIAGRTGLGFMCLLGWERRKKTLNTSTWDFPFLVLIHHFCDSWAKNTLLNMRTYGHERKLLINASSAISTQNNRQLSKYQHHWLLKTLLSLNTSYSEQECHSHGLLPCSLGQVSKLRPFLHIHSAKHSWIDCFLRHLPEALLDALREDRYNRCFSSVRGFVSSLSALKSQRCWTE